jgi:hypothetical protein
VAFRDNHTSHASRTRSKLSALILHDRPCSGLARRGWEKRLLKMKIDRRCPPRFGENVERLGGAINVRQPCFEGALTTLRSASARRRRHELIRNHSDKLHVTKIPNYDNTKSNFLDNRSTPVACPARSFHHTSTPAISTPSSATRWPKPHPRVGL